MTSYKITIRRKNGVLLIKETRDMMVIKGYRKTAEMYGDKVVKIEEKETPYSPWGPAKSLLGLAATGLGLTIGLGLLGSVGNAFKK
jgi:fibrillarin-like rRNA methylase